MSKSFCWTLNNYSEKEENTIKDLYDKYANYIVFGKEKGEECHTPHLQGYIELTNIMKLTTLKNIIGKRCHLELRSGSQNDAVNYCKKGEQTKSEWREKKEKGANFGLNADVFEIGILAVKHQGKRTDIAKCRSLAKIGGMRAVTKQATSLQSIKVAEKFLEYNEKKRDFKTNVIWIWGSSGTGKSHKARERCADINDIFTKNDGSKWWIGYDGHESVIIDDFRDSWWGITEMLSLLDKYEKRIETKGGSRQLLAKTIIVTSIHSPNDCYKGCADEPIQQLLRRIDETIHLTSVYNSTANEKNIEDLSAFFPVEEVAVEEVEGNTRDLDFINEDFLDAPKYKFEVKKPLFENKKIEKKNCICTCCQYCDCCDCDSSICIFAD
nr:putative replication associated protein [Crucivirus sp.]